MRKWIGRWVLLAIAVPLAAAGARRLSEAVEHKRGPSRTSGLLRKSADMLSNMSGRHGKRGRR